MTTGPVDSLATVPARVLVVVLVAFLAVLGVFAALSWRGLDTGGLVQLVVTVGGLLGLGAAHHGSTRKQNAVLSKIDKQTNGVLTKRIEDGAEAAVRRVLTERDAAAAAQASAADVPVTLAQD